MKLQVQLENGEMRETIAKSSDSMASVPLRFSPTLARPRLATLPATGRAAMQIHPRHSSGLLGGCGKHAALSSASAHIGSAWGTRWHPPCHHSCPKRPPSTVHCQNANQPTGACLHRFIIFDVLCVPQVRTKIEEQLGIPQDRQRLWFGGASPTAHPRA